MSSAFRRIYPGASQILFDGGKNNKYERSIISDNESPDCLNVVFSNGSVGTRNGSVKLNTSAIGSFVIDGLYTRREDTGAETMVAFAGGSAWQLGISTFTTISSAQSVFTAGVRIATTQYQEKMFIGNGGVIPYKYDGVNFTRHGVYPPTTTSTVASNATGVLTGDYRYKITSVNSFLAESDVGPVTSTFTAASATLRITSIPVFPQSYGINARRLYRTVAGGSTFKRVAEISDNTTTQYDDNNADSVLGTNAPTDNGVPPKYSVCVYHQNRLFVNDPSNPNYLWYSGLGEPYTFSSTNFIKVSDATSDIIKGLSVYGNSVVVYCEKSIQMIFMRDENPDNWTPPIKLDSPFGTKSPFSIIDYNNKQLFVAVQNNKLVGIATLSGNTIEPTATLLSVSAAGSFLKSDRIEPDVFLMQESFMGNYSGIVFKNKAYLSVTYGSNQTRNNRVYVYDFSISNLSKNNKEAWVPWSGLNVAQFTIYDGKLYYGSSTATGFIYQLEAGVYSDDGSAINSYFWTKEFSGFPEETNFNKDFRDVSILIDKAGDYFMNLTYRVDSDSGDGNTVQINLDPGASLWGTMMWGRDEWGGGSDQEDYRQFLAGARGKRIQFKFSNQNTVNQRFKVHSMKFSYNRKGYR